MINHINKYEKNGVKVYKIIKKIVRIVAIASLIHICFLIILKLFIMTDLISETLINSRDFSMFYLLCVLVAIVSSNNIREGKAEERTDESMKLGLDLGLDMDMDMDMSYNKLIETNRMLEDSNAILAESNAELFTVQYIVKDINSIFNIKDLSNRVNDIIIGIMGASNVSLLFLHNEKKRFKLYSNTIKSREEQIKFLDNINCEALFLAIKEGRAYYDNDADCIKYPFLTGRDVKSIMMVPMIRDGKKSGVAIIEHHMPDYFSDDKLRFMEVVGQQVLLAFEKVELYNRVLDIAVRDGLTGVYNRVFFQQKLNEEIKRAKENGWDITLVLMDIDLFKAFNDTYGHTFGDKVIKHTVDVVKSSLRKGDVIARFGGEEFVIILPQAGGKEAYNRIERMRQVLQNTTIRENDMEVAVTASFGIASYPNNAICDDDLIRAADEALYDAKKSGRNCVKVFAPTEVPNHKTINIMSIRSIK